jgi:hypothetical protein
LNGDVRNTAAHVDVTEVDELDSGGIEIETLKERFLISRDRESADVVEEDKENGMSNGSKIRRRYKISLIVGEREKEDEEILEEPVTTDVAKVVEVPIADPPPEPAPEDVKDSSASMDVDPSPLPPPLPTIADKPSQEPIVNTWDTPPAEDSTVIQEPSKSSRASTEATSGFKQSDAPAEDNISTPVLPSSQPPSISKDPPLSEKEPSTFATTSVMSPAVEPSSHPPVHQKQNKKELVLQLLQQNISEENFQFGEDGIGILSNEVETGDVRKGLLIEVVRWRRALV